MTKVTNISTVVTIQAIPWYGLNSYESYVAIIKKMKSGGNCVKKGLKVLEMGI